MGNRSSSRMLILKIQGLYKLTFIKVVFMESVFICPSLESRGIEVNFKESLCYPASMFNFIEIASKQATVEYSVKHLAFIIILKATQSKLLDSTA